MPYILNPNVSWIRQDYDALRTTVIVSHPSKPLPDQPQKSYSDIFTPHWEAFCKALRATGANVVECEPEVESARRVFTRDPVVKLGNKIFCGRFTYPHMSENMYPQGKAAAEKHFKGEQRSLLRAMRRHKKPTQQQEVVWLDQHLHGGNVIVDHHAKRVYLGFTAEENNRLDLHTRKKIDDIRKHTSYQVVSIAVDNTTDYYHLDTFFGLDEKTGQAYLYPQATDSTSYRVLKMMLGNKLHTISEDEAANMSPQQYAQATQQAMAGRPIASGFTSGLMGVQAGIESLASK
ncbi:MAG: hypothetical protein EBV03_04420, partial [Proteobacteria bacterium]|nr:hypothetical protein [Pseudomonadota bacterium]